MAMGERGWLQTERGMERRLQVFSRRRRGRTEKAKLKLGGAGLGLAPLSV